MRRSPQNHVPPSGRRQVMSEDALAQVQRHSPSGATGYRMSIELVNGTAFFPRPGAASHLTFEGFRRKGDAFALIPEFELPRVPIEDHYAVTYVGHGGRQLPTKGTIVVHLPSSAPTPLKVRKRLPAAHTIAGAPDQRVLLFPVDVMRTALGATGGNVARAARMLGTQRTQLAWQLIKAGVRAADFRRPSSGPVAEADSRPAVGDVE